MPSSMVPVPSWYETPLAASISSPSMEAEMSTETKSSATTGRSTVIRVPKRSRRLSTRASTSSSLTSTSSTVTSMPSRSGSVDLGPDVDLGGELQVAACTRVRDAGDGDGRLAERADVTVLDRLGVEPRERVVDGLLEDCAACRSAGR